MIERHFYRTTSSIWLGLVKGGGGMLKALLCAYQIVTDPDTDPETATRGVVTHILVPHCCTRNYYFVVVWLNQEGEPSHAVYYQFKTEAMERFPVVAAPGTRNPSNILMVDPQNGQFIELLLALAAQCLRGFLASFVACARLRRLSRVHLSTTMELAETLPRVRVSHGSVAGTAKNQYHSPSLNQ